MVLYLASSASDVTVRMLSQRDDGRVYESAAPERLPSNTVTVLNVYGSLFFAGARTLAERLPSPAGAVRPTVVLRLRGYTQVGATLVEVLDDYADELAEAGGRLYLSGVDEDVSEHLRRAGKLDLEGAVRLVPAVDDLGASTRHAVADARAWLGVAHRGVPQVEKE